MKQSFLQLIHRPPVTPTSSGHSLTDQDVPSIVKSVLDALPTPTSSSDRYPGHTSSSQEISARKLRNQYSFDNFIAMYMHACMCDYQLLPLLHELL